MADAAQLEAALVNADKAGDVDAARALAAELVKVRQAPAQPVTAGERGAATVGGVNRGIAGLLGMPVDAVQNVLNLGIAGYGAAKGAITGDGGASPEPITGAVGGSDWIAKRLQGVGINTQNPRPDDPASRMLYTGGAVAGGSLVPGAKIGPTLASAASGAVAGETLGPEYIGPATMLPAALSQARSAPQPAPNPIAAQTGADAKAAGYTIPPTQTNPTVWNRILEGFAGKLTTAQQASAKNQEITNMLARRSLGLPDDAPLTPETLSNMRAQAGEAYQAIKDFGGGKVKFKPDQTFRSEIDSIGGQFAQAAKEFPALLDNKAVTNLKAELTKGPMSPTAAVELVKSLRQEATTNLKSFDDNAKLALGRAQRAAADSIEGLIERNLAASGRPEMVKEFRDARQAIARTYDIESALNDATGNVSARGIAKLANKGKPLGEDLQRVGDFANAFPKAAQNPETMGSLPGLSPLDYLVGMAGATVGGPYAALAAFTRPIVRSTILSGPYQRTLGTPSAPSGPVQPESTLAQIIRATAAEGQR